MVIAMCSDISNGRMSLLQYLVDTEQYLMVDIWAENGDPRVTWLPLMTTARVPTLIMISYLFFVLYLGPRLMAKREAFKLKAVLLVYNICMSSFNAYVVFYLLSDFGYHAPRMLNPIWPPHSDTSPKTMELIFYNYLYIASKFVDLLDTVFFVLRKKDSQITGLHVYHHWTVAYLGWMGFRMNGSCDIAAPFALANGLVHTLMYSYYALSALGPAVRPYLWWKRHLTQLQIFQFGILGFHITYIMLNNVGYPIFFTYNYIFNVIFYLIFFSRFYKQAYKQKKID